MTRLVYIIALVVALVLGSHSTPAMAQGFENRMQETFNSLSNYTQPRIHLDARRGIISGGSLTVRNKVMTASLFNFQPPSVNFGCGGWDLFSGSFSFISSDQLIAMMRSIASAAVAYAFELALRAICDDCANVMTNLKKAADYMNGLQMNSCRIGEIIGKAATGNTDGFIANNAGTTLLVEMGFKDDPSEGQNPGETESSGVEAAKADPALKEKIVKGNHIWKALHAQGAEWWWSGGSNDSSTMEHIMSMTGTIIVCVPGLDGCPESVETTGQEDFNEGTLEGVMSLEQLIKGSDSYTGIQVWRCNEPMNCLDPRQGEEVSFDGTEKMLLDRLLGETRSNGEGIIGRWADGTGTPSAADLALIGSGSAYISMAMNIAVRNEAAARLFVMDFSEQIAADLTAATIGQILTATLEATALLESGGLQKAQKMILSAQQRLSDDLKTIHARAQTKGNQYAYYDMLMNSMEQPALPLPTQNQGS